MPRFKSRWKEPTFLFDIAQAAVAAIVGVVLALDMTGIWSGPAWISNNISNLTFIAVCLLIVSAFLERQIAINRLERITSQKLDDILLQQNEFSKKMQDFPPTGISLNDRRAFTAPFEVLLENIEHVDILGLSLVGVVTHYRSFLLTRARAGCKFRFILVDPNSYAVSSAVGFVEADEQYRKEEIQNSIRRLEPLLETGNAQLRFTSVAPCFSLVILDPDEPTGQVRVELYVYNVDVSDSPHFILTQDLDKKWYDFFRQQFNKLWKDARPHNA